MTSRCDPHHTERYNDEVALKNNSEPNGSSTSNTSMYPNNILVTRRSASQSKNDFYSQTSYLMTPTKDHVQDTGCVCKA